MIGAGIGCRLVVEAVDKPGKEQQRNTSKGIAWRLAQGSSQPHARLIPAGDPALLVHGEKSVDFNNGCPVAKADIPGQDPNVAIITLEMRPHLQRAREKPPQDKKANHQPLLL